MNVSLNNQINSIHTKNILKQKPCFSSYKLSNNVKPEQQISFNGWGALKKIFSVFRQEAPKTIAKVEVKLKPASAEMADKVAYKTLKKPANSRSIVTFIMPKGEPLEKVGEAYLRSGRRFHSSGNLEEAQNYLRFSVQVLEEAGDKGKEFLRDAYEELGSLLIRYPSKRAEGMETLEKALSLPNQSSKSSIGNVMILKKMAYFQKNDVEAYRETLNRARNVCKEAMYNGEMNSNAYFRQIYSEILSTLESTFKLSEYRHPERMAIGQEEIDMGIYLSKHIIKPPPIIGYTNQNRYF